MCRISRDFRRSLSHSARSVARRQTFFHTLQWPIQGGVTAPPPLEKKTIRGGPRPPPLEIKNDIFLVPFSPKLFLKIGSSKYDHIDSLIQTDPLGKKSEFRHPAGSPPPWRNPGSSCHCSYK